MTEYLPILIVGAIIGSFAVAFLIAYAALQKKLFGFVAEGYVNRGNVLHFEEGLDSVQIRELADAIAETCSGTAAVFSGSDEAGYAFCLVTRNGDLRAFCREMTTALGGRGGGKPECQMGTVRAGEESILKHFVSFYIPE